MRKARVGCGWGRRIIKAYIADKMKKGDVIWQKKS